MRLRDGSTVSVPVRRSRRSRRLRLVVGPEHPLEAVVPPRTGTRTIDRFLAERRDWIADRLTEIEAQLEGATRLGLDRPGTVWLAGEPHRVELSGATRPGARLVGGVLRVGGPPARAEEAVARWYRRQARDRLEGAVGREQRLLGVSAGRVRVGDQRTRWGSCSTTGTASFSWRLVLCPPRILDYVVVHELCHLREMHHGRRFWELLDAARPGWREQSAWLDEHGLELRRHVVRLPTVRGPDSHPTG